ncbi:MAG: elongation factor G, partial [Thermoanaerobaculia bacterium]|nr:elongation factor G [Thermoanaerobaculia bacterium]
MQAETPENIRNLAVVGHSDTGKTTLMSALLYTGGVVNRLNKVEDGNTTTDFDPEEISRGGSIGLAACFVPWKGTKINFIDCPGSGIFFCETKAGIRAADAALLCVNAVAGIEVTTENAWDYAAELELPVMIHLTKMDRERARMERTLEALRERFGREIVAIQLPIGREQEFEGVVDLIEEKAYRFEKDGDGKAKATEVPEELAERVARFRTQLVELVAESNDELMERFFDAGTLSTEELREGLRAAVARRQIVPLTLGSPLHGIGSQTLLDAVLALAPSPAERASFPATNVGGDPVDIDLAADAPPNALIFKTMSDPYSGKMSLLRVVSGTLAADSSVWNTQREEVERLGHLGVVQGKETKGVSELVAGDIGSVPKLKNAQSGDTLSSKENPIRLGWIEIPQPAISFAIEPKSKGDEEKIGEALHRLIEEDPTLSFGRDADTGEFLLSGAGQLHVELAVSKLKNRFGVDVILHPPKVPYREAIRRPAEGHGRHKKQSGGRGQFADCKITVEPLPRGEDFEFVDEIFGGAIPQTYRPAVEKGIQEARQRGYLAGYPVVDFRVRLTDGQYHDVDSSEMAFKIAGSLAFKDALAKAGVTLLEPIMQVEITTSEEFTGDVISDLSQRRGKPQGMESKNGAQVVNAQVPMAEMLNYAPAL